MMMPMGIIEGKLAFSIAKSRPVACITVVMRTLDIAQFYLKKNGQDGCGVGARCGMRCIAREGGKQGINILDEAESLA